jgi:anti-anti-sigma factor
MFIERDRVTVVVVRGSIDSLNADEFTELLAEPIERGASRMVIDFSEVTYVSSAGLRSLLSTVKSCRRRAGDLRLAALQPQVEHVLSVAGFTSFMQVFADRDRAVESFEAAA